MFYVQSSGMYIFRFRGGLSGFLGVAWWCPVGSSWQRVWLLKCQLDPFWITLHFSDSSGKRWNNKCFFQCEPSNSSSNDVTMSLCLVDGRVINNLKSFWSSCIEWSKPLKFKQFGPCSSRNLIFFWTSLPAWSEGRLKLLYVGSWTLQNGAKFRFGITRLDKNIFNVFPGQKTLGIFIPF